MAECIIVGNSGTGGNGDYEFSFSENGLFQYPSKVIIPNYVTSLTGNNTRCFTNHTEIEEIDFEENSSITSIPLSCFSGCTGLKTMVLSDGITSVAQNAFMGNTSLETVKFKSSQEKEITLAQGVFRNCSNLRELLLDNVIFKINGANIFYNCTSISDDLVAKILSHMSSSSTNGEGLFNGCTAITKVNSPFAFNQIFMSCTGLTEAVISHLTTGLITEVFSGCTNLENVTIVEGDINIGLGNNYFKDCISLKNVSLPSKVTHIGSIFSGCTALESVIFNSIPTCSYYTNTNLYNPFYKCTSLSNLTLPSGWNQNIVISNGTSTFTNVLTTECLKSLFESLYDFSDGTAHTLQIGSINLQKAINTTYIPDGEIDAVPIINIAYNKNWTVS